VLSTLLDRCMGRGPGRLRAGHLGLLHLKRLTRDYFEALDDLAGSTTCSSSYTFLETKTPTRTSATNVSGGVR